MAANPATRGAPTNKPTLKVPPIPPNQTLYVTNLPSSKIQKDDLKTALYMLFSTYGTVLDIVALKTLRMRGQAHIVFRDIQAATQAMRSLDGAPFLGRDVRVQYAKSKSDIVAKLDGSFKIPGAASNVEVTELQHSIFNAPVPGATNTTAPPPAPPGLAVKTPSAVADATSPDSRGQKRSREEEDEEGDSDEDVAMEEDSDDE